MKKVILAIIFAIIVHLSFSQSIVFHENFESPSMGDSVISSGTPSWFINTNLYSDGSRSFRDTLNLTDTTYLTTNSFSTLGSNVVSLSFDHICKLEHFDNAEIEVSVDNGVSWIKLTASHYQGNGQFGQIGNRFTATSYSLWDATNNSLAPTNSWWKTEVFNLSSIAGNKANVKIRFKLSNGSGGIPGMNAAYGWLIDNIKVSLPALQEASLVKWYLPASLPSGCGLSNENFQIKIKNNGGGNINGNLQANYQRVGKNVVSEIIPDTILNGDSLLYTFNTKIDLNPVLGDTTYFFKTWISLAGDVSLSNDTLNDSVKVKIALAPPVINDTTINYMTSVTLTASSTNTLNWYSDPTASNLLVAGASFTSPVLYDTTTYYVLASNLSSVCTSIAKPVKVNVIGLPHNDAGVVSISSPPSIFTAGQSYPINIKIKNFGVDTLKKVTVNWMVDGMLKTPLVWNGSLSKNGISYTLTLGYETFSAGVYTMKFWTSGPNDSLDIANQNDTLSFKIFSCLSGTFSIGGTSADFPTLQSAKASLDNLGICGPVVFNINPGIYVGNVDFIYVNGVSATNTITFQSATGNRADVIVQYTATSATDNYVIRLNAGDYYCFKNLTLRALGTTFGACYVIHNGSDSNTFIGNQTECGVATTCYGFWDYNTINTYNSYINNKVNGGFAGIYVFGISNTSWEKGTLIQGNEIYNFGTYGIYAKYQDSTQIIGNTIYNPSNASCYGINAEYLNNAYRISNNKITLNPITSAYGIRDYYGNHYSYNASPSGYGILANNFVSITSGSGQNYGIYESYSNGSQLLHNSLNMAAGSTSSYNLYQYNTTSNTLGNTFKNNIFNNKIAGCYAAYFGTPALVIASDYNDYFSSGTNLVYWGAAYSSLAALQSATSKDLHSKNIDPQFMSNQDLHLNNPLLNNQGIACGITTDIDGDTRSLTTPDIGADEFDLILRDASVIAMTSPVSACPGNLASVAVQIKNLGLDTLKSCTINWSVNGIIQTPLNSTDTIVPNGNVIKTLGNYTFVANTIYSLHFWTSNPNGQPDQKTTNDTLVIPNFKTAIPGGTYTIGGAGADYSSFSQAVISLENSGICGPVVFNVAPGTYTESLNIHPINGASAINTITFQSANGVNTDVVLQYSGTSLNDNYVVQFYGTDYVSFKKMTIKGIGTNYGTVISISNEANYNTVSNCIIQTAATTSSNGIAILDNAANDNYFNIIDNTITGGYYAIKLYGTSSSSWQKGNVIRGNNISGFNFYGILCYYHDSLQILNNYVHDGLAVNQWGIDVQYVNNAYCVKNNKVVIGAGTYGYAMREQYGNSATYNPTPTGFGLVANNMLSVISGTGTNYVLYLSNSNGTKYIHNSFNLSAGGSSSYTIYQTNIAANTLGQIFKNNIYTNTINVPAINFGYPSTVVSDYNNYFTNGSTLIYAAGNYTSLTAFQTATGKDMHSIVMNPLYVSNIDLHVKNAQLNNLGTYLGITNDIDNELRDTVHPDMGADEFTPPANEVKVIGLYTLGKLAKKASNPHQVMAIVENTGTENRVNFPIILSVSGANTFNYTLTLDTLLAFQKDTILFPPYISNNLGVQNVKISLPTDYDTSNNTANYRQEVTDSVFAYSDTSAISSFYGFGNTSGLMLSKFYIPSNRSIVAVNAYIGNSGIIGNKVYAVVMNKNGVILDTSNTKTLTAADTSKIVNFPLANYFYTNTNNDSVYVGLAQITGSNFNPLGLQYENPARPNIFYKANLNGGNLIQISGNGRPVIEVVSSAPLTKDIKALSFVNPLSGCNLGLQQVKLKIKNVGIDTIFGASTSLTVGYKMKNTGISPVVETITATILPGQEYVHTFVGTINMTANTADSTYQFVGFATLQNDLFKANDTTAVDTVVSKKTPLIPTANNVSIPYGSSTTLSANSTSNILWYASDTSTVVLHSGANFTTPILYDSASYFAESTTKQSLAVTATIGGGNLTNTNQSWPSPYGQFYTGNKEQYLILASELSAVGMSAGQINSLAFDVVTPSNATSTGANLTNYTIKMGGTQLTALSQWQSNTTQVYSVPNFITNSGWNTHTFQTPYMWNGIDNLIVEICFDNFVSGTNSSVNAICNQTSTGFASTLDYHSHNGNVCASPGTAGTFNQRPNIKFNAVGLIDGCSSNRIPVKVNLTSIPANDAGVVQIDNPLSSAQPNISTPIVVRLKNYGTNNLTTAAVNYSIDGVLKPVYNANGLNVAKGNISSPITIGNQIFSPGLHVLKAWTTDVNALPGQYATNDTAEISFTVCFAGTVTVGASGADFTSPWDAVQAIKSAGMCGKTTINILPGTYTGQLDLSGLSTWLTDNSLTIKSSTGNPADVIIQFNSGLTTNNYVVSFNNTDSVILRDLTLKALNSNLGKVIELSNGSENNLIYNNIISSQNSTSLNNAGIYSGNAGIDRNNIIRKNKIYYGYYGIYVTGTTSKMENGLVIDSNLISEFYFAGISISYQDSFKIQANSMFGNNTSTYAYGIYQNYCQFAGDISANKIHLNSTQYTYGMYINGCIFSSSTPSFVYNNFISNENGPAYAYGIRSEGNYYINFYNNSISINSGSSSYCIYQNTGTAINYTNNNLINKAGGYAYYNASPASVANINYNNYFTNGSNLAYWNGNIANLAALKSANVQDNNSVSVDAAFYGLSDLHTNTIAINNVGTYFPTVSKDIDGETRNTMTPDIGADEFTPPANDAGLDSISSPLSIITTANQNIKVKLVNGGTNALTGVNIHWKIDNQLQTPFVWTGNLASTAAVSNLQIGTYTFAAGSHSLKVWVSNPNGVQDIFPNNDTLNTTIVMCSGGLKGSYTIGGSSANYPDFTSAVAGLNSCGIDSSVIFNVNPGIYNEQISLGVIAGSNATNTILFKSANNDSTSVVLTYGNATSAKNYVLNLNGSSYVTFQNISVTATTVGNGNAIFINGTAHHNTIKNSIVRATAGMSSNSSSIIFLNSTNENYNIIHNNKVENGYYGIFVNGSSTTNWEKGNIITNNEVSGFYVYGICAIHQDSVQIKSNYVHDGGSSDHYGIYLNYCFNSYQVINNKIILTPVSYASGIVDYYGNVTTYNPSPLGFGLIANNFIALNSGTGANYGMNAQYGNGSQYVYNSIHISSGSNASAAINQLNTTTNLLGQIFKNNIASNQSGGYALNFNTLSSITSDYNDFYTNGTQLTSGASSLSAWQTLSMQDAHSMSVDPGFISNSNLHSTNVALNAMATPITAITTDFDGDLRDASTPDIGADEFSPQNNDAGAYAFIQPSLSYSPSTSAIQIEFSFKNYGLSTITAMNIGYSIDNGTPVVYNWNGNLSPNSSASHLFTNSFSLSQGSHLIKAFTILSNDANLSNDTISITYISMPILNLSYKDSFDQSSGNWATSGTQHLWEWGIPAGGILNSPHTAPNVWGTNLDGLYGTNANECLYSPYFDFSGISNATLKFWQKYSSELNNDYMRVQYSTNLGQNWTTLGYIGDPLATNWYTTNSAGQHGWSGTSAWKQSTYDLSQFNNSTNPVQFRFQIITNGSVNNEGWMIDDFEISIPVVPLDAAMHSIVSPKNSIAFGGSDSVKIRIQNNGTDTLTSIPVFYRINNGAAVNAIWSGILPSGASTVFTFPSMMIAPAGTSFEICAGVNLVGDPYNQNDSVCETVLINPPALDAGVSKIISQPNGTTGYIPESVVIRIKNYGSDTIKSMNLQYKIAIQTPVIESWNGILKPGDSTDFTFVQKFNSPAGLFALCAKTLLSGDMISSNDEICKNLIINGIEDIWFNNFNLSQNHPNPTGGNTKIDFEIPVSGKVNFNITNLLGQTLKSENLNLSSGKHSINVDATNLQQGVYYYSIEIEGHRLVKKMIVSK